MCIFLFVGMGRLPMRYVLHPTFCCPNPLDSEQLCKFQFIAPMRTAPDSLPLEGKVARREP